MNFKTNDPSCTEREAGRRIQGIVTLLPQKPMLYFDGFSFPRIRSRVRITRINKF